MFQTLRDTHRHAQLITPIKIVCNTLQPFVTSFLDSDNFATIKVTQSHIESFRNLKNGFVDESP